MKVKRKQKDIWLLSQAKRPTDTPYEQSYTEIPFTPTGHGRTAIQTEHAPSLQGIAD